MNTQHFPYWAELTFTNQRADLPARAWEPGRPVLLSPPHLCAVGASVSLRISGRFMLDDYSFSSITV